MSDERSSGGGFGAFLLGIAVGAVVGFLFAPEAGDDTRRKLSKRLRNLRDVAEEKVDEVRGMLEAETGEADEGEEEEDEGSIRERLERRLDAARRRRRRGARGAAAQVEEEDEPLA